MKGDHIVTVRWPDAVIPRCSVRVGSPGGRGSEGG